MKDCTQQHVEEIGRYETNGMPLVLTPENARQGREAEKCPSDEAGTFPVLTTRRRGPGRAIAAGVPIHAPGLPYPLPPSPPHRLAPSLHISPPNGGRSPRYRYFGVAVSSVEKRDPCPISPRGVRDTIRLTQISLGHSHWLATV